MCAFDATREQVVDFGVGVEQFQHAHRLNRVLGTLADRIERGRGAGSIQDQRVGEILAGELVAVHRFRFNVVARFFDMIAHGVETGAEVGARLITRGWAAGEEASIDPFLGQVGRFAEFGRFPDVDHR